MSGGRAFRHQLPARSPITMKALASGVIGAVGVARREGSRRDLAGALGTLHPGADVLLLDGGTAALRLAIELSATRGGTVALPAYGCFDLASAALGAGARVDFYDLDPSTLGPDMESVERALRRGARSVVAAHLYGVPVDVPELERVSRGYQVTLLDDAAQGAGAAIAGRPLGSFGSFGVLSFGRGKGVTAGRGGALLANDDAGRALMRSLPGLGAPPHGARGFVPLLAQWALGRPWAYWLPASIPALRLGETTFRRPQPARPLSDVGVAVLRHSLRTVRAESEARRRNAAWLQERLGDLVEHVRIVGDSLPGYLRLPVLVSPSLAEQARSRAARALGVAPGYPITLPELEQLQEALVTPRYRLPGAGDLVRRLITLPVHGGMRLRDLEAVVRWCGGR